jgi:hypothetical protein
MGRSWSRPRMASASVFAIFRLAMGITADP